ncbi:hypothetical protein CcNV_058 [Crangon crangon nudivirus]|uniref:Uncharacterized protein n=1 Tax=Crangon crangon nudivirus TaxID=2880838 RepID=A0AAE9BZ80_9VIRU|nr:hypothetical protein QKT25_gp059 [Crangon crangon nudivirus]UBZ25543.1 hypothetical protein CcNV_058 [Crangon crangon nudivirus]
MASTFDGEQYTLDKKQQARRDKLKSLDKIIEKYNIYNKSIFLFKIPTRTKNNIKKRYRLADIYSAIEGYANMLTERAFEFVESRGERGLPFRYIAVDNFTRGYLRANTKERKLYDQYIDSPLANLCAGAMLLQYIKILQGTGPKFFTEIEGILNQIDDKKNTLSIQGVANSGKSIIARLICNYVNAGRIGKPKKITRFVFQNFIDRRVVHLDEYVLPKRLVPDYLNWFAKDDEALVYFKGKPPVRGGHKPVFIMTSKSNQLRKVGPKYKEAMDNRIEKYEFHSPLDPGVIEANNASFGYGSRFTLTPFHYLLMIILEQKEDQSFWNTCSELEDVIRPYAQRYSELLYDPTVSCKDLDEWFAISNIDFQPSPNKEFVDSDTDDEVVYPAEYDNYYDITIGPQRQIYTEDQCYW